jgi:hypothetical protein
MYQYGNLFCIGICTVRKQKKKSRVIQPAITGVSVCVLMTDKKCNKLQNMYLLNHIALVSCREI